MTRAPLFAFESGGTILQRGPWIVSVRVDTDRIHVYTVSAFNAAQAGELAEARAMTEGLTPTGHLEPVRLRR